MSIDRFTARARSVLVLTALAGLVTACSRDPSVSVTPAGGGDKTQPGPGDAQAHLIDAELLERLPSLARIEQALAGAPVNVGISDGARLADIRGWLAANKPEVDERQREVLAQMLAVLDELTTAESVSLGKLQGLGEIEMLQLWATDQDGDGVLSDEEADSSMQRQMEGWEAFGEYHTAEYDTDGDGELSPEEEEAMERRLEQSMMPAFETMTERAALVSWDTNKDGVLSDDERAEGEAGLDIDDWDGDGEISPEEWMDGHYELVEEMLSAFMLVDQPDEEQINAHMDPEYVELTERMNRPWPDSNEFDLDGDGVMSPEETATYEAEIAVRQAEQAELSEQFNNGNYNVWTAMTKARYASVVGRLDADGDGQLASGEWEKGYGIFRGERDARMFRYLYDADRSGGVTDDEVARFMDAYEQGSAYADADLDGKIDPRDLRRFIDLVSGQ